MTDPGPRLAEGMRPTSVRLRPTQAGRMLIAVAFAAMVLSWLHAGPVFAVAAVFECGIGVAAALAAWRHASRLRVVAPGPATTFARERFVLDVGVVNGARRATAFDVVGTLRGPVGERAAATAFLPSVAAGTEARMSLPMPALRRGRHAQGTLELESTFPLGLAVCRLVFELPDEIVALPRLGSLRGLGAGERTRSRASVHGNSGPGDEQEIYGVRAWREGESLRSVHWKLSARRARLLVREFRSEPLPPVRVIFSTAVAAPPANEKGRDAARAREAFEDAVSLAATVLEHHVRHGHAVRLVVAGKARRSVDCRRERGGFVRALRLLAEVEAETDGAESPAKPFTRDRAADGARPGEVTFLVRAGGPKDESDAQAASRAGSRRGSRTACVRVLDAADPAIASVYDRTRRPGRDVLAGMRR